MSLKYKLEIEVGRESSDAVYVAKKKKSRKVRLLRSSSSELPSLPAPHTHKLFVERAHACMHTHTCTHAHAHTRAHACIYACMYACVHTCGYVRTCTHDTPTLDPPV